MEEMMFNEIMSELDILRKNSLNNGFMTDDFKNCNTRIKGYYTDSIKDSIEEHVTAAEYRILAHTTYQSTKEDIEKYIAILTKLLVAGVFDYRGNTNVYGGFNRYINNESQPNPNTNNTTSTENND